MYATLGVVPRSKWSGKLIGTHQKLDKAARRLLGQKLFVGRTFPSINEILRFEGMQGPDGLKRKTPGVDEPEHFIQPNADDGVLIGIIRNHHYNLVQALIKKDRVRASFEAAWLAHAITDGLTPAHHYPYHEAVNELMGEKDYKTILGVEIKGIMRGKNFLEVARNNWLYWGAGGIMTKHIAYEYGVAYIITPVTLKRLIPETVTTADLEQADCERAFYDALYKIAPLKMYDHFREKGWTTELAVETREILIPEIIKAITLAWASAFNRAKQEERQHAQKK